MHELLQEDLAEKSKFDFEFEIKEIEVEYMAGKILGDR